MENVIIASFDPTIFSSRPLSDLAAHRSIQWKISTRDYPRLCTAHLYTKVPIVLQTSANIRKFAKAGAFPKIEAIYYDPFTRYYYLPPSMEKRDQQDKTFNNVINREPTDQELVRFFQRCHNLAKRNYTRQTTHAHQRKAQPLNIDTDTENEEEEEEELPHFLKPKSKVPSSAQIIKDDVNTPIEDNISNPFKVPKVRFPDLTPQTVRWDDDLVPMYRFGQETDKCTSSRADLQQLARQARARDSYFT